MLLAVRMLLLALSCFALPMAAAAEAERGEQRDLAQPYDGHPWAMLGRARIEARYLPVGLTDDEAIRRAVEDGTLSEAVYPSLQVSDDVTYVLLRKFTRSTLNRRRSILALCKQEHGFRLLLEEAGRCDAAVAPDLQFVEQDNGRLWCRNCASVGVPVYWERHDPPPRAHPGTGAGQLRP